MKLALKNIKKKKKFFSAIKQSRCNYYTRVLNLHQNNSKFFFRTIQRLSGDIKPKVLPSGFTDKALAETFSKFFDEKITSTHTTFN